MSHINRYKGNRLADCNTVVLPQNLITKLGILYEGFENKNDWTLSGTGAAIADNVTEYRTGQSVKVSTGSGQLAKITKTVNWDFSASWQQFRFWMYLHNTTLTDYGGNITLYLSEATDFSTSWKINVLAIGLYQSGWNLVTCPKAWFSVNSGSPNWSNPIVRMRLEFTGASGKIAEISFDDFYAGYNGVPTVMLRFDDGDPTQHSVAFKCMKGVNIRGTLFQIGTWINQSYGLTASQLREMQSNGWIIGNHTHDHTNLTTLSEGDQEIEISGGNTDLNAIGIIGGGYVAYPSGLWNANTVIALTNINSLLGCGTSPSALIGSSTYPPAVLPSYEVPLIYNFHANTVVSVAIATITGWIDNTIVIGSCLPILIHAIDGIGGRISVADFQTLIDYIVIKSKAGLIYPITIDDLYKLSLGPVRVPKAK